jgi:predicted methyltransferase
MSMSALSKTTMFTASLAVLLCVAGIATAVEITANQAIIKAISTDERSDADHKRDTTSKPAQVLEFFGLESGMVVIDLFGGGGYYTELAARVVGDEGKVYHHTNHAYIPFIESELELRFANERLAGVTRLLSEADDLGLPEGEADMVLMVMCYHDLFLVDEGWPEIDRELFWKQVRAALKPGGTLAVVDHVAKAGTGSSEVQKLHRIDKDFAKTDIEAAGFVFEAESDVLRNPDDNHSLIVFNPEIRRKTDRFVYKFTKPTSD